MKDFWKKVLLTAVIVFSFGTVGFQLMHPPEMLLTRGEQAVFEAHVLVNCPLLVYDYEQVKIKDHVPYDYAITKMEACNDIIMKSNNPRAVQTIEEYAHEAASQHIINTKED